MNSQLLTMLGHTEPRLNLQRRWDGPYHGRRIVAARASEAMRLIAATARLGDMVPQPLG